MGKENNSQTRKYSLAQIRVVLNIIVNGYSQYPVDFSQPGIFATSPPETSIMVLHSILDRVNWKKMTIDSNPEHTLEKSPSTSKEHRLALDNEKLIHDFILKHVQYHNSDIKNVVKRSNKSNKEKKKGKKSKLKQDLSLSPITSDTWAGVCKHLFQFGQLFPKHADKHAIVIFQIFCEELAKAYLWLDVKTFLSDRNHVALFQGDNPWLRLKLEVLDEESACRMLLDFIGELNQHDHLKEVAEAIHQFLHIGRLVIINQDKNGMTKESIAMLFSQCLIDGLNVMGHGLPSFHSQDLDKMPLLEKLAKVANAPFQQLISTFIMHPVFTLPFHHDKTQESYNKFRQDEALYQEKLKAYSAMEKECNEHLWQAVSGYSPAMSDIEEVSTMLEPGSTKKGFLKLDLSSIFQSKSPSSSPKSLKEKHSPHAQEDTAKRSPKKEGTRQRKGSRIRQLLSKDAQSSTKSEQMPKDLILSSQSVPLLKKEPQRKKRLSAHLGLKKDKKNQAIWRSLQELTIKDENDVDAFNNEASRKPVLFSQNFINLTPLSSSVEVDENDEDCEVEELIQPELPKVQRRLK